MSERVLRLVSGAIVTLSVIFAVSASVLAWLNRDTTIPANWTLGSDALDIAFPILALTMTSVALLIGRRDPRHIVAWMFLLLGGGAELLLVTQAYGIYGTLTAPGSLPAAGVCLWLATWTWSVPVGALVVALLVFPSGRPLGSRWWTVAWVAVVAGALQGFADAFRTPIYLAGTGLVSPFGTPFAVDVLDAISIVGTIAWAAATLAAAASLVIRFRRASGVERLQLKWVALGFGSAAVAIVVASVIYAIPGLAAVSGALGALGILLVPISAALAILRYHLYDIDLVIERTLVYGMLSASVAATYWILVILLQSALRPLTGGSEIAVAGSTLATLALVQPLRTRIQRAVDRRFYRERYDAARAVDAFSVRLRDEVALEAVRGDLLDVVHETVEPAHASVWLRQAGP
ncbi:MAG TPA: hypothetical protein VGK15_03595 [Candidatus Limnocylindria bacterium]|jgi:hypothetical protein